MRRSSCYLHTCRHAVSASREVLPLFLENQLHSFTSLKMIFINAILLRKNKTVYITSTAVVYLSINAYALRRRLPSSYPGFPHALKRLACLGPGGSPVATKPGRFSSITQPPMADGLVGRAEQTPHSYSPHLQWACPISRVDTQRGETRQPPSPSPMLSASCILSYSYSFT